MIRKPSFFILTSIDASNEYPAMKNNDGVFIVVVNCDENYEALKTFREKDRFVGCLAITEESAYKLVLEHGGVGVGCYIPEAPNDAVEGAGRRSRARSNLEALCRIVIGFRIHAPVILKEPQKEVRAGFMLPASGVNYFPAHNI